MNKTGIEYCDYTWNPFIGCNMYSSGCINCYAYASLPRMVSAGIEGYTMDFDPYFFENRINEPREVTQKSIIFCCSMGFSAALWEIFSFRRMIHGVTEFWQLWKNIQIMYF